jgi:hypothetical protein
MTSLVGQVAVVTGAGKGIGAAIAAKLAGMGATVVLAGRTREPLESTSDAIAKAGGQAEPVVCDVMHLSSVEALAAHVDKDSRPARHSGKQCRRRRLRRPAPPTSFRILGPGAEYQLARSLLLHSRLRSPDDSRSCRTHHQYLFARRKECSAQWRGVRRIEMGTERLELFSCRRTARLQYSRLGSLSRLRRH